MAILSVSSPAESEDASAPLRRHWLQLIFKDHNSSLRGVLSSFQGVVAKDMKRSSENVCQTASVCPSFFKDAVGGRMANRGGLPYIGRPHPAAYDAPSYGA